MYYFVSSSFAQTVKKTEHTFSSTSEGRMSKKQFPEGLEKSINLFARWRSIFQKIALVQHVSTKEGGKTRANGTELIES
jgi:hypothetical protein